MLEVFGIAIGLIIVNKLVEIHMRADIMSQEIQNELKIIR